MSLHAYIVRQLLNAPMTMADMQSASQVSLPTLRKAVQELIETHWICVVGQAETNGGRPAMLFGVDRRYYQIVGVHLQLPGLRLVTTDLMGRVLDEAALFQDTVPTPSQALQAVEDYVANVRRRYPDRLILGTGIATPGFTDPVTGDILSVGRVTGWHNLPICHRLRETTGVPVTIANDIDCMALAEFQHTGQPLGRNLAYVGFDEGIKVSLFLKGELYQSSLGNAGLISSDLLHVKSIDDRQQVRNLLTIVGINRVFEQRLQDLDETARQPYAHILEADSRQRFHLILDGAVSELPVCVEITRDLISAISAAIANVIYFIQPDITVIGGLLGLFPSELFVRLEQAIGEHLPTIIHNNALVRLARLSSANSAAMGAVHYFVQNHLLEVLGDQLPDRSRGNTNGKS